MPLLLKIGKYSFTASRLCGVVALALTVNAYASRPPQVGVDHASHHNRALIFHEVKYIDMLSLHPGTQNAGSSPQISTANGMAMPVYCLDNVACYSLQQKVTSVWNGQLAGIRAQQQ
ncbi:hypothetical protein [Serratia proteamaculans]|uniref:Uncharacterized protein n=1 Tax=Serratia proteamaculans TaxID=28151 RepID=A0A5Q2V754_SERPR|nr:hypothetical protein [Serratia proteamaculans]QGH61352.1 hypothetical protein GHV41_11095 [Serratia proteamaculans]